jgi:hypothetical protein
MSQMRKLSGVLLVALTLGGCSMVTSDKALFDAADAAGAPPLRPGLWVMPDGACEFDPTSPATDWPKCANTTVVTARTLAGGPRDAAGAPIQTLTYLLAGGDPRVGQLQAPPEEKEGPAYLYVGLRPTAFDSDRRITAAKIWAALCAKPATAGGDLTATANKLLPGLTRRPGGQECVAKAQGPVREAVRISEGWLASGDKDDFSLSARWVREGDR